MTINGVACLAYIYKIGTLVFTNHQSDKGIHVTIGNRAWPSLNRGSFEIIIMYLTGLKNRHVLGNFIK